MLPVTTLFALMSLDGKISTGVSDDQDFDKDLPKISGLAEGLEQYYHLEESTDRFSLNTGRVLAKVGWNDLKTDIKRLPVIFIVVDSTHLTERGVRNLLQRTEGLIVVTTNHEHPAVHVDDSGLELLKVEHPIDFRFLFGILAAMGVHNLTVQSGGTLNSELVRVGLINYVSVVVAPLLVGGKLTPTLIDGDIQLPQPLQLLSANSLDHSYLHLYYAVAREEGR